MSSWSLIPLPTHRHNYMLHTRAPDPESLSRLTVIPVSMETEQPDKGS